MRVTSDIFFHVVQPIVILYPSHIYNSKTKYLRNETDISSIILYRHYYNIIQQADDNTDII